jgi:hypothetical protein
VAIAGCTYRHTDWWEGFMKYAVEMGSGAMIYVPSFIKIASAIQKVIWGKHTHSMEMYEGLFDKRFSLKDL